jgi:PhnB protein
MQTNPYLVFDGRCEEAFAFYARTLHGKVTAMMRHGGTPMEAHAPPEWREKILHARVEIGADVLMGSDAPPDRYETPRGFSVSLTIDDPAEAERVFRALAEGGAVRMPIQKTFWAARFGMLVDRFAIPWMVNCEGQG